MNLPKKIAAMATPMVGIAILLAIPASAQTVMGNKAEANSPAGPAPATLSMRAKASSTQLAPPSKSAAALSAPAPRVASDMK